MSQCLQTDWTVQSLIKQLKNSGKMLIVVVWRNFDGVTDYALDV